MRPVLSPEFDLRVFCYQVMDKNPAEVMSAASAEISYHRHNHRERTARRQFRIGTKARRYCDNLQLLIRMLMSGQIPNNPAPEFIEGVRPLVRSLLRKWRLGNLEEHFRE